MFGTTQQDQQILVIDIETEDGLEIHLLSIYQDLKLNQVFTLMVFMVKLILNILFMQQLVNMKQL